MEGSGAADDGQPAGEDVPVELTQPSSKRRKVPKPEPVEFDTSDMVESVQVLPFDKLMLDKELSHGQVCDLKVLTMDACACKE